MWVMSLVCLYVDSKCEVSEIDSNIAVVHLRVGDVLVAKRREYYYNPEEYMSVAKVYKKHGVSKVFLMFGIHNRMLSLFHNY